MEQKKKRNPWMTLLNVAFVVIMVMVIGAAAVIMLARIPLAEPMNLVIATNTPTVVGNQSQTATPAADSPGSCGAKGAQIILFVGADFSKGVWPPGADSVRVIKVDYDKGEVTVIAFPRDLWVKTPALASQNITSTRLGLAYDYMKNGTSGTEKHKITVATSLVAQILQDEFEQKTENYFTLQLDTLPELVNAMGGVDIVNPQAFTSDYNVKFPAGAQRLDGKQAQEFVRTFKPGGDPARRQRQTLFVKATQKTLLNLGTVTKIPELANAFNQTVVTDLTPEMIVKLTCMLQNTPQDKINFYEIGKELVVERAVGEPIPALEPKVDLIKKQIQKWQGQ